MGPCDPLFGEEVLENILLKILKSLWNYLKYLFKTNMFAKSYASWSLNMCSFKSKVFGQEVLEKLLKIFDFWSKDRWNYYYFFFNIISNWKVLENNLSVSLKTHNFLSGGPWKYFIKNIDFCLGDRWNYFFKKYFIKKSKIFGFKTIWLGSP